MPLTTKINNDLKYIELKTSGELDMPLFIEMAKVSIGLINETGYTNFLVDHTDAQGSGMSYENIEELAEACQVMNQYMPGGKSALVAGSEVDFGLGRMWQTLTEGTLNYESRLFKTKAEAKLWLAGIPTQ